VGGKQRRTTTAVPQTRAEGPQAAPRAPGGRGNAALQEALKAKAAAGGAGKVNTLAKLGGAQAGAAAERARRAQPLPGTVYERRLYRQGLLPPGGTDMEARLAQYRQGTPAMQRATRFSERVGQTTAKVGKGLGVAGVVGGVVNTAQGVSKMRDDKNHDGDGFLQSVEGVGGTVASAATLAGATGAAAAGASVAGAAATGVGLGRRGNKAVADSGLLGKTAGGRNRDLSDMIADDTIAARDWVTEKTGMEGLGNVAAGAVFAGEAVGSIPLAAVAGLGGIAEDLSNMPLSTSWLLDKAAGWATGD
jgi:hypothetical protein